MALKEFLQHSEESKEVLRQACKQASRQTSPRERSRESSSKRAQARPTPITSIGRWPSTMRGMCPMKNVMMCLRSIVPCHQVTMPKHKEKCTKKPKEECNYLHKKDPVRVRKKIPKKFCNDGYTSVVTNQAPVTSQGPATNVSSSCYRSSWSFKWSSYCNLSFCHPCCDWDDEDDAGPNYSDNGNVRDAVIVRDNDDDAPLAQINVPLSRALEVDAAVKKVYREGTISCNVTHCKG